MVEREGTVWRGAAVKGSKELIVDPCAVTFF
jgi:hypothetical protein